MYKVLYSGGYVKRNYKHTFDSLGAAVRYFAENLKKSDKQEIHSVTCGSRYVNVRKFRRCVLIEARK